MQPVVNVAEMRAAERAYVEAGGQVADLMQRAGSAVAARLAGHGRTLVLVGPGNNGGDGLVAARLLHASGAPVSVYALTRPESAESALTVITAEEDAGCEKLKRELDLAGVVVDALLGVGKARPVRGMLAAILECANAAAAWRLAVDIPTGVDADTGQVESVAFHAHTTVTMGFPKRGLYAFPGAGYAGEVHTANLDLPASMLIRPSCYMPAPTDIARSLPSRSQDFNKGKSGTVAVVAGSRDYSGAPLLVSMASYRVGAGLVRLAVPPAVLPVVAAHALEPVFTHIRGHGGSFRLEDVDDVAAALIKADAFVIGPGLGQRSDTWNFVRALLARVAHSDIPGVLDADGLNAVAGLDRWWEHAPRNLVLTPHPGEMSRLRHTTVAAVQADRFGTASEAAETWGKVVLLKGAFTLVADPDGIMSVNPTGGPNLATAGTGDVLSGIIAGLMAQGMRPRNAAMTGAWMHGAAGDTVAAELGESGTIASDLLPAIPHVRAALAGKTARSESLIGGLS